MGGKQSKADDHAAAEKADDEREEWESPIAGEPNWAEEIEKEFPGRCVKDDGELDVVTLRVLWLAHGRDLKMVKKLVAGMIVREIGVVAKPAGEEPPKGLFAKSTTRSGDFIKGILDPVLSDTQKTDIVAQKIGRACGVNPKSCLRKAATLSTAKAVENEYFDKADLVKFVKMSFAQSRYQSDANDGDINPESPQMVEKALHLLTCISQEDLDDYKSQRGKDDITEVAAGQMWRVKLIISSIKAGAVERKIGEFSSAFPYGATHAGLLVGPNVIEWGYDGVIEPQRVDEYVHRHSMMCVDVNWALGKHQAHFISREEIVRLCAVIEKWNTKQTYSQVRANCQHFVQDCLRALGMNFSYSNKTGANMKLFLEQISRGVLAKEIKFRFTFGKEQMIFTKHAALDRFISDHEDDLSVEDLALLKAYDRAFWLRYFALINSPDPSLWVDNANEKCRQVHGRDLTDAEREVVLEKVKAAEEEEADCLHDFTGCGFKDPRDTGTFGNQDQNVPIDVGSGSGTTSASGPTSATNQP